MVEKLLSKDEIVNILDKLYYEISGDDSSFSSNASEIQDQIT